eukprot:9482275-Pyramimonas_sp.AAC.1
MPPKTQRGPRPCRPGFERPWATRSPFGAHPGRPEALMDPPKNQRNGIKIPIQPCRGRSWATRGPPCGASLAPRNVDIVDI